MNGENKTLEQLVLLKEDLLKEINNIQENFEGYNKKENLKKILSLNNEKLELILTEDKLKKDLGFIQNKLNLINRKIDNLSSDGLNRILSAIEKQRFYFLKNKPKVILDIKTGAMITNLDYIDDANKSYNLYFIDDREKVEKKINNLELEGHTNWDFLDEKYLEELIRNNNFYLHKYLNSGFWLCKNNNVIKGMNQTGYTYNNVKACIIACSYDLSDENYKINMKDDNKIYTKEEKLKISLNLFIENSLEPIFENDEITRLYKSMYLEKPILLKKLNEIEKQIDEIKKEVVLSSVFDYNKILLKYDIKKIDNSIIKYYKSIQLWIDELIKEINYFEDKKLNIINEFNIYKLKILENYKEDTNLSKKENLLLKNRKLFLRKNIDLGMNNIKNKLLLVKNQADSLESRIEDINNSENSIELLAYLEEEKRASFNFIAENTANIIKKALLKVEYFENNKDFINKIINLESKWSENYILFKTKYKEEFKYLNEKNNIEKVVYMSWFKDWRYKRYISEKSFTKLIEQNIEKFGGIALEVIDILQKYNENIDNFYKNERKNIYQKYRFILGGEIKENLDVEKELNKIICEFQNDLKNILIKLNKSEDKIFLFNLENYLINSKENEELDLEESDYFNNISQNSTNKFINLKETI